MRLSVEPRCSGTPWARHFRLAFGVCSLAVLLACGGGGSTPAPVIERFQADQTQVEVGSEVNLEAKFSHGTGVVDNQGGVLPGSGIVKVSPVGTTTYTLTVTNDRGEKAQRSTTVIVNPGLVVTVEAPEGVTGEVTVNGPDGFNRMVNKSEVLTGLKAGRYTLAAAPVKREDATFHPWRPVQEVDVQTGTPVKVSYTPSTLSLQLPGAVPLDFVLIPAGQFTMGYDNPACPRRFPKQSPSHQVTIHRAFYLAKFPTSQGQWQAIMGNNPSPRANSNYAVNSVSYETIKKEFLPKIGKMFPELAFRLPSEAEWEYAYRAGTTTNFFFGDDELKAGAFAWTIDAYRMQEHPVGMKLPNPWGLHDLTGLVFQWCEDMAHDGYTGAPLDGSPWMAPGPDAREGERILRGYPPMAITGSLRYGSSADRWSRNKSEEDEYIGFRLVATHN